MSEVPATRTPITREQAAAALVAAWPDVDRETAAMLLALAWMETGQGHNAVQHSPGNITAGEEYPSLWRPPWYPEPTPETPAKLVRLHELMLAGRAPKAFRAYPNWEAGFSNFRTFLLQNYERLLAEASTGDVSRFRAELARKYSGDYTPAHDKGLTQHRDAFAPLVSSQPAPKSGSTPGNPGFDFGSLKGLAMAYLALKGLG
jgi:hypothetical protein